MTLELTAAVTELILTAPDAGVTYVVALNPSITRAVNALDADGLLALTDGGTNMTIAKVGSKVRFTATAGSGSSMIPAFWVAADTAVDGTATTVQILGVGGSPFGPPTAVAALEGATVVFASNAGVPDKTVYVVHESTPWDVVPTPFGTEIYSMTTSQQFTASNLAIFGVFPDPGSPVDRVFTPQAPATDMADQSFVPTVTTRYLGAGPLSPKAAFDILNLPRMNDVLDDTSTELAPYTLDQFSEMVYVADTAAADRWLQLGVHGGLPRHVWAHNNGAGTLHIVGSPADGTEGAAYTLDVGPGQHFLILPNQDQWEARPMFPQIAAGGANEGMVGVVRGAGINYEAPSGGGGTVASADSTVTVTEPTAGNFDLSLALYARPTFCVDASYTVVAGDNRIYVDSDVTSEILLPTAKRWPILLDRHAGSADLNIRLVGPSNLATITAADDRYWWLLPSYDSWVVMPIDIDARIGALADPLGAASGAISTHTGLSDPHAQYLLESDNLASLQSATTARSNLGLGDAATKSVGTAAGTVMAGNDARWVSTARTLAGLDLSADRTASALRTALGLVIGTDVQALDSDLTAIAALSTTSYGRNLLTLAAGTAGYVVGADGTLMALGSAAPGTPSGGAQNYSLPGVAYAGISALLVTLNTAYVRPFYVTAPIAVDRLICEVSTGAAAGKVLGMAIYAASTAWQPSGAALASTGSVAADSTGVKSTTVSVTLQPGRYLVMFASDGAPTVRSGAPTAMAVPQEIDSAVFGGSSNIVSYQRTGVFAFGAFPNPGPSWTTSLKGSNMGNEPLQLMRWSVA